MNMRLVMQRKRKRIWAAELRRSEATLGRAIGCTVRIPSAEVSRQHCRLRIENGVVTVEDLESANGTFINGARVRDIEIVHPGDRLRVGPVTFVVEYELTPEALRDLGGTEDYDVVVVDENTEIVEPADSQPPINPLPLAEPLEASEEGEKVKEVNTEAFIFDDKEEMHLPEGDDLRNFLTELDDDTGERSNKPKK